MPKPDSPCNYIENNIGPDGCAIFWKLNRLELLKYSKRILRVYKYKTNQIALCATFRHIDSGRELCVATTHLKARRGPILSAFRNEQGLCPSFQIKTLFNTFFKNRKRFDQIFREEK